MPSAECKVHLRREIGSLDSYILLIKDPVQTIRIYDRNVLIDMYMHQSEQFITKSEPPITYNIHGNKYTFDFWTAADIHHTVESWFWEYVETAESRAL